MTQLGVFLLLFLLPAHLSWDYSGKSGKTRLVLKSEITAGVLIFSAECTIGMV